MKRHFYISDDLDDLESIEHQLEGAGVITPQIHVLSEDDAGVKSHHLNDVEAVLRKDVVQGTERGAVVGILGAIVVIGAAWASGIADTITWVPPIFLSLIILGFCTWEGGLIGISEPHADFARFKDTLRSGKHVLVVDVEEKQESILRRVTSEHPKLTPAGESNATHGWFIGVRRIFEQIIHGTAWRTTLHR